ncbi:MAG: hypothetical protein ACREEC_01485 [Thermoplasmata archaeon]
MPRNWLVGVLALIVVFVVAGVGYAAFTSSASITAGAGAGTFGPLTWGSTGGVAPYYDSGCPSYVNEYSPVVSGSSITVGVSNMAPGDTCSVHMYLQNAGTLAGTLSEIITCTVMTGPSNSCSQFTYTDNIPTATIPAISGGGVGCSVDGCYGVTATLGLDSGAGDTYMGALVIFHVAVTGTAT